MVVISAILMPVILSIIISKINLLRIYSETICRWTFLWNSTFSSDRMSEGSKSVGARSKGSNTGVGPVSSAAGQQRSKHHNPTKGSYFMVCCPAYILQCSGKKTSIPTSGTWLARSGTNKIGMCEYKAYKVWMLSANITRLLFTSIYILRKKTGEQTDGPKGFWSQLNN